MDVYADNLIAGLRQVRPDWEIVEEFPRPWDSQHNAWKSGTGLRKYLERYWHHPRRVSQQQADIFHIIDHSNAHVAYWLRGKSQSEIVVTCHDLVLLIFPEILRDQARFPAWSMTTWRYSIAGMQQANAVIAVSSNTAQDITQHLHLPSEKVVVIPEAVEATFHLLPPSEVQQFRQQHTRTLGEICLLNVGTTHLRKNILTVLKVLERLRNRGVSIHLWRVGDDFNSEQQQFIQAHQLGDLITRFDRLDQATLNQLYNATDILLAPSLYEGFGFPVLEAMACGTPVITSKVSSLPEVAGDAAILVEPMDVSAIVDAICHLHQDAAYRQTLIDKGLARVQGFTWTATAEKTARVYERLVRAS
jgi:glycosyltransferase involved in cell wall biosynthesis